MAEEDIQICLKHFMEKENISNYKYEVVGKTAEGDGYLGTIVFVNVSENNGTSGKPKTFNLVIKTSIDNPILMKYIPIKDAFKKEIRIYNDIIKCFNEFQQEKKIKEPFKSVPKFYGHLKENNTYHVILENKRVEGFKLWDIKRPQTLDHVRLVLHEYAKLHALSFALKDKKPEVFRKLTENYSDGTAKFLLQPNLLPNAIEIMKRIKVNLKSKGDFNLLEKIDNYENELPYIISTLCSEEKYDFVVLHGDCWNNNYIFNYKDDNCMKPSEVCILDWQLSMLGSPAVDVIHYYYCCASSRDLLEHFDEQLNLYYQTFSNFLKLLGSDPTKLYPEKRFHENMKRYATYGLAVMLITLIGSTSLEEGSHDFVQAAIDGNFSQIFTTKRIDETEYHRRTRDAFLHAFEKGYLG